MKIVRRSLASGRTTFAAKWKDPDSGKEKKLSLDKLGLSNNAQRCEWATRKADQVRGRSSALAGGAARHTGKGLAEAIEQTITQAVESQEIRATTAETYRIGARKFLTWCEGRGIKSGDEIEPPMLTQFRYDLSTEKAKRPKKGGARRDRVESKRKQSPASVNNRLRSVKAVLNRMRRAGLLPHISRDDLADHLKQLKFKGKRPFLRAAQIKDLLKSVAAHDADGPDTPLMGFVLFLLLSGCRRGEALEHLTWDHVDLNAPNERGELVGEIVIPEEGKTGERAVDLSISPALKRLLSGMKLKATGPKLFGWDRAKVDARRKILVSEYGAPKFDWQMLRRTCGTFQANAPGLWGSASIYQTARQLGNSVKIVEDYYAGRLKGLPRDVHTLEGLMGIEKQVSKALARVA